MSYDDPRALKDYVEGNDIRFTMLSDIDSRVIRAYGILNTATAPGNFAYGVPYPGTYVADEAGVIVAKFFYDSYKRRENPHAIMNAALGRTELPEASPGASSGDGQCRVRVGFQGGAIKQGSQRRVIVRFELVDGSFVLGRPAPEDLVAVRIGVTGPDGLVVEDASYPPRSRVRTAPDLEVEGWTGVTDVEIPVYAQSRIASELRALEETELEIFVKVRYQVCTEAERLPPRTEDFTLTVPIDTIDVPDLGIFAGRGQKSVRMRTKSHLARLVWRTFRSEPRGFIKAIIDQRRMEREARARGAASGR